MGAHLTFHSTILNQASRGKTQSGLRQEYEEPRPYTFFFWFVSTITDYFTPIFDPSSFPSILPPAGRSSKREPFALAHQSLGANAPVSSLSTDNKRKETTKERVVSADDKLRLRSGPQERPQSVEDDCEAMRDTTPEDRATKRHAAKIPNGDIE